MPNQKHAKSVLSFISQRPFIQHQQEIFCLLQNIHTGSPELLFNLTGTDTALFWVIT
jgi:hypothetical protein